MALYSLLLWVFKDYNSFTLFYNQLQNVGKLITSLTVIVMKWLALEASFFLATASMFCYAYRREKLKEVTS